MTILYDFIPSKVVRDTISNDADKVTSFAKSFKTTMPVWLIQDVR